MRQLGSQECISSQRIDRRTILSSWQDSFGFPVFVPGSRRPAGHVNRQQGYGGGKNHKNDDKNATIPVH